MKFILKKKIYFKTFITKKISNKLLKKILNLKKEHYKFTYNNQLNWFKKNIKLYDLHNLTFYNNNLIGYTCLRFSEITNNNHTRKVFLFDTCVIKKKFRGYGIGRKIMLYNNKIIRKENIPAILLCKKDLANFYIKFDWKQINKKKIFFTDHKTKKLKLFGKNFKISSKSNYKIKLN